MERYRPVAISLCFPPDFGQAQPAMPPTPKPSAGFPMVLAATPSGTPRHPHAP